jgi:nucleoside-diphosphate-sugar epimerase
MNASEGKRLVIFGCGYVGTAVALDALARGGRVTALTRSETSALVLREQGITAVAADLASHAWHGEIEGGPDFVLNCVSAGGGGTPAYRHNYIDGMASVVAWARKRGAAGTIVYTSSTSVYPQDGGVLVDESAPTAGTSERGRLLVEAEEQLRNSAGACGRWFILRLAGLYGPGRHHLMDQVRAGRVAGVGEHRLNLIHRDDVVAAAASCFDAPPAIRDEVFNVADDHPARKSEVVEWLAAALGVPRPQFTREPAGDRRTVTPDRIIANGKLKTVLGWRPRYPSFRDGYARIAGTVPA